MVFRIIAGIIAFLVIVGVGYFVTKQPNENASNGSDVIGTFPAPTPAGSPAVVPVVPIPATQTDQQMQDAINDLNLN